MSCLTADGHGDAGDDVLTEYVVEQLLGRVGVQHEEFRYEEKLSASIVHQCVLHRPEEHLVWIALVSLLLGMGHNYGSLRDINYCLTPGVLGRKFMSFTSAVFILQTINRLKQIIHKS